MEIEFENLPESLNISDYVIRELTRESPGGERWTGPHLQARYTCKEDVKHHFGDVTIAYYDNEGNFLGFDESRMISLNSTFQVPLNIPAPCTKGRVSVRFGNFNGGSTLTTMILFFLVMILAATTIVSVSVVLAQH